MYDVNNKDLVKKNDYAVNVNEINATDVELGEDISIDEIKENIIKNKEEVTGYTAGLITRDLVKLGESMIKRNKK